MALSESDEWTKTVRGMKVRFSYQRLIAGFSVSAEILEPVEATMVYTHIHLDLAAPNNRLDIEHEFLAELVEAGHGQIAYAHLGRYRSAS